jgi:hypothetical protein
MPVQTLKKLAKPTPGPWRFEQGEVRHIRAADGESLMCDEQYYPWCPGADADWNLIAASPEMLVALEGLICPQCNHELGLHVDKYGCEQERGDREGDEGEVAQAMGPCGCNDDDLTEDYPDIRRALRALRKAKGREL